MSEPLPPPAQARSRRSAEIRAPADARTARFDDARWRADLKKSIIFAGARLASSRAHAGRVGTPEEVSSAVFFLASDEAVWCTGATLDCNGASFLRL